jgi:catechol 2,3-dioxygenase-like lactoylglutathione lyase family enzyme
MILNHLDLQVSDVKSSVLFFERFFGLTMKTSKNSPALAILGDDTGFVLVLQKKKNPEQTYPDGFHLGFLVDRVDIVEDAHARLREAGVEVSDIDTNSRGTMIYCRAPDGILVEVSCRAR